MKNNKGITMIEMVIVIIILILLAVITVWNTRSSYLKAEGANIYTEFVQLRKGAEMLLTFYNTGSLEDYQQGVHYCTKYEDSNGKTWFTLYGQDELGQTWYNARDAESPDKGKNIFKAVKDAWGLDELKRSYDVFISDDKVEIKFSDNRYVEINNYKVYSYDDIKVLQESGAF